MHAFKTLWWLAASYSSSTCESSCGATLLLLLLLLLLACCSELVGAGYAYIMTHPGIPCVFWDHYVTWGAELHNTIKTLAAVSATDDFCFGCCQKLSVPNSVGAAGHQDAGHVEQEPKILSCTIYNTLPSPSQLNSAQYVLQVRPSMHSCCLHIHRRSGIVADSKVKLLAAESDLYVANAVRIASHHRLFTLAACRSAAASASLRTAR
jgi:hypothetical protein